MNAAGLTLTMPGLESDAADYTASLDTTYDEPKTHSYIGSLAYEKDLQRRRIWEALGPRATVADWVQACKEQGL